MRTSAIVKYSFTAIGIFMFLGAIYFYLDTHNFLKSAITTNGTVIDIERSEKSVIRSTRTETSYRPVIAFKTENGGLIEFISPTGSNRPSYTKREVVEVLYQKSNPQEAKINSFFSLWGMTVILAALGAAFFGIGYSIILLSQHKEKKIAYLKQNGVSVKAMFHSVTVNTSMRVNGRNPYQIAAQWKDPNTSLLHTFKSENIWFDPTVHIKDEEITVLVENNNPKNHYVDISFLPEALD